MYFFCVDGSDVEKAPFLAKPVRLTPAWEANNLPNDELNFKGNCFNIGFYFVQYIFSVVLKG